ncbi:MAG: cytochrome c oxidase assembly protein [Acidimicrobiales bacterium]|nr:cytochrome c oxidase assembly protein [Acidimicrobiales bacterium]
MAVSWWCSSSSRAWSWTPSPYIGAWVILVAVIATAVWWRARGRHQEREPDAREAAALERGSGPYPSGSTSRSVAFAFGVLGLWACLDWPLAALGAGYLATAQMARQILMVLVVAPLLLYACPPGLAVRLVGWGKRLTVLRLVARPFVAIAIAALSLVAVNAPAVVDPLVRTPYGAFVLDGIWIVAGFVLWMPVQCPHPGVRRLEGPVALGYLILQSIVPVLPGFWMTWADFPIYRVYELAPRVIEGFDAVSDQQAAAAVLQVGGMVVLWFQIAFRFLRWGYAQMEDGRGGRPRPGASSGGASDGDGAGAKPIRGAAAPAS